MSKIKSILAFAALMLCGGAWATIKPVAVWQAGTIDTMQGGTVNFNIAENASDTKGNTRNNDGSVTIVKRPIQVTLDADKAFSVNNGYTILVKYSGFVSSTAMQTLVAARINTDDLIGLYTLNTTGTLAGIWNNGAWSTTGGGSNVIPSSGTVALAASSGTWCYAMSNDSAAEYYGSSSLWGSNRTFYGAAIGGMTSHATSDPTTNGLQPMTGLTVSGIAIFEGKANTTDVQNYVWPSDEIKYSATISSGESNWANLSWDTTWENNVNASVAKIKVTGDSTLNIAAAVSAKRVEIDIDENVTLSMKGNNAITTFDNIYVTGKGSVKFTEQTNGFTMIGGTSPKMNLGADATMVMYKAGQWNYSGVNFQNISGTGAIRLEGSDWQYINGAANIWSTDHDTIVNLAKGMIIQAGSYTFANLSGSGTIRTDWGGSANDRSATAYMTKNTTWSGGIYEDGTGRFNTFTVAGLGETKTLTYTGTSTSQAGALTVDASGSMKMDGTWQAKNAVAINGEFGGSGSITGNGTITVGVGAKIRADWSGANGPVTLFTAPTMGALVDVVATEVTAGNKIKLFNGTFTASDATTHARIFVGEDVHYGTVSIESDGVYATVSDEATTAAMDTAAKYKYEMNGSFTNTGHGDELTVVGSFATGDFSNNKLQLGTNVTKHYGTGFSFGSDEWTIVTAVKAPAANQCILGVGGQSGTAGMVGLRNAGSNQIKLFTAGGAEVASVTLGSDPATALHVYTIVYSAGQIKMNVNGGEFTTPVAFTPSTAGAWQLGGVYAGGPSGAGNAGSGEMDAWRLYSYPFVKADSYFVTTEFIAQAKIGNKKYVTIADAITAAGDNALDTITILDNSAAVPAGYAKMTKNDVTTIRKVGGDVYYVSGSLYNQPGSGEFDCVVETSDGWTTSYNEVETLVIDGDHTSENGGYWNATTVYKKVRISKDFELYPGADNAVLGAGVEFTIDSNCALTFKKNDDYPRAFTLGTATIKGSGEIEYDACETANVPGFTLSDWTGVVTIKDFGTIGNPSKPSDNQNVTWTNLNNLFGKVGNKVKFIGVCGYYTGDKSSVDLILENGGTDREWGWRNDNGSSSGSATFKSISGGGKFMDTFTCSQSMLFKDASNFTGTIQAVTGGKKYTLGADSMHANAQNGTIYVDGNVKGATFNGPTVIADGITIDISEGNMTVDGALTFGNTLTITGTNLQEGDTVIAVENFDGLLPALSRDFSLEYADNKIKIAGTIATLTAKNGTVVNFKSMANALQASVIAGVPVVLTRDYPGNVLLPEGAILDLGNYTIRGSVTLASGAYIIENGKPKIDGYATSFDVTYTNVNAFAYRYKNTGSCRSENNNNPGYNNEAEDETTGALLSGHPWIEGIDQTFFTGTKQLTLATAGVMPHENNTMFTHMGNTSGSNYGLYLATGESADEVIVGYNVGSDTNLITKITVPNARSERHSYVITKDDDTTSTPTKTTFVIYLDGLKWKTFERIPRFEITGGFQSGSDFGGALSRNNKFANVASSDTKSYVNYLRIYNRVISQAEISRYAEVYDYNSPNGTYERTMSAGGNWVADNAWTSGENTVEKPSSNGNVVLTANAVGSRTDVTVNLSEEVEYEKLTLKGTAMSFARADESTKPIKSVCTVIATDVTLGEGAVDLTAGPTIIVEGGKLKFDFSGLQIGEGESFDQILTGDIDETDAVSVIAPTDTSFYFALVYENHHYKAIAREYYQYWPSKDQNVWATATDAEEGDHVNKNLCVNEKGTQSSIVADKEVYFDTDHWNNSKVLYLKSIAGAKIRVCEGVVLKIGYSSGDECNLNGATVNIEDGAEVQIAYWTEDSSGTAALKNTVTFNAVGTSKTGKVTLVANAVTAPTLAGDVSITAAAKIGTTYYSSASAAINAAGEDDTVTLLQDVEGDLTISANKLLDAGSHAINGFISVGDAAILTLSGTPTIKGISGSGKVIIDSTGTVVAKNKAGGYAVEDATIQIDRGTFQVALGESGGYSDSSVAGDPSIKNAKFIVGANGTLANNGWVNMEGEISLSADTNKSVFSSTAFRGTPSIVKSGSGVITFTLVRGGGNEAFKFTSLTINGGAIKINSLTPTGNLISGVTGKLVLAKTVSDVTTYSLIDPVATYNGVDYATLAAAIEAAGEENIGFIVVHNSNATAPGYRAKGGKVVTAADYYSRWTNTESAAAIIDLKSTASFHNANFAVYYPATDTESEAFNGDSAGTPPFGNLGSLNKPWTIFASLINGGANSAYIAPGVALRFTGDVQGALMDATFAPLTFAGFIVEPGATGFGYKSWRTDSNRHTEVGRTGYTTHSHISEDFEIYRARENTAMGLTFKGTHVLEIDAQKTFHINDAAKDSHNYADEQYKTTVEEGGCLKLVGTGTLSISTLNAAGATIDLSAIGSATTAFITGNVAVNASTLVYFPADWTAGTAMKLCSGTISGVETSGEVDVKIGEKTEHVILSYDSANGTVSYAYAPTAQTWDNGTIIFDGDLHHLTPVSEGVYTKTINDVTYTINLNGHELVTENGKSYILIKGPNEGNNTTLGVTITRNAQTETECGETALVKYSNYPEFTANKYPVPIALQTTSYNNIAAAIVANAQGGMKCGWADFFPVAGNNNNNTGAYNDTGSSSAFSQEGETYALTYGGKTTAGVCAFQRVYGAWNKVYENAGLSGNNTYNATGFAVGGLYVAHGRNSQYGSEAIVAAGMKIYSVAVTYTPIKSVTNESLTSFAWPSDDMGDSVAKVGFDGYPTIEAAIAAADAGDEKVVQLLQDITTGAAVNIPSGVSVMIATHGIDRAVTGSGTLIINKDINANTDTTVNLPAALTNSLKNNAWTGEVILVGGYNGVQMNSMQNLFNANSTLTSKGNKGWLLQNSLQEAKLKLVDNGSTPALHISRSSANWTYLIKTLIGDGTLKVNSSDNTLSAIRVADGSEFCGNIDMSNLALYFGDSATTAQNGLIKINSGTTMKVYSGKTWHAGPGGIEVAGTIKGSGTLEGTAIFDAGSTLDLTDGMLTATTATASGAFTVKVSNLAEFLSGEKKVMTLTAGGNTIAAAQVTVTDGTDTAQTTYVLKATATAAVLVEPESHTWTGATDGSINNAANWGTDEMFSGDNKFVVFPADAATKTLTVSDITLGKMTINGAYTFTGNGTIILSDLEFGNEGSLVLGTGTTLKFPGAIDKSLLAKITFAGGTYAFENLPSFTESDIFSIDATKLVPGSYVLASWAGKMALNQSGYGKPTVNVSGLNPAYSTRVVCLVGKLYVQIIDTAAQAKKKTYKVWAVGDSITEGYNSNSTCANYRTQLAAKLALAGYNIEMVGYYDHRNKMPSGEDAPAEWSFHSGVSGQRIWTRSSTGGTSTHAGYVDAIDAALFQVGTDVDVVTVLLGTNDLGNGNDTAQHAFDGWKIVVKKILDGCPNAKVVVSPLIDMHSASGSGKRASYNQLITNGITEANFGSDVSRIYNANLQNYVIGSTDDLMFNDGYHPSWDGHDAMSTGWFNTIKNIIDKNALAVAPTPKDPAALGVVNNAADYAEGFTLIRKLEIPQQVAYALGEAPKYSAITEVADVTKVGYYMELVRDDASDMRYVWVDMDVPVGTTLDKLLVPTGANLQCVVNNLHVKSNMGSVTTVAKDQDGVNGFIEFSPFGNTSGAASGVTGAPAETWPAGNSAYNWNDTLATSGNGRGVMQIHRIFDNPAADEHGGEVLFAWNNWGAGNTVDGQKNGEIGIGNFAQHYMADNSNGGIGKKVGLTLASGLSMDYTFLRWDRWGDRMNTKAYTVRNLEIWAKGTVTRHHLMSDEEEVEVEAVSEEAALGKAVIDVQDSEADAAANTGAGNTQGQAQYLTLVATKVGESNNWKVQAVVDNTKLPENKKIDDTAIAFANAGNIVKLAGATEKQTISIPKTSTTAGLYYSVSFGTTPDNHTQESERVLATSGEGTVDIPVPALGNEKVYYIKVKASATK